MEPLKVMYVLSDFGMGGAQLVAKEFAASLDRSRFSPSFCLLREGGGLTASLDEAGIPWQVCRFSSRLSPMGLLKLAVIMRMQGIAIVHTHLRRANIAGRLAAVLAGVPVVIAHSHDLLAEANLSKRLIERFLHKRTAKFLCVSQAVAKSQAAASGLPQDYYSVFYNFITPKLFHSKLSKAEAKAALGLPMEAPCIGIAGRLSPIKQHWLFLESAKCLKQKMPAAHFSIIGDGSLREELIKKAADLGLRDCVHFHGALSDMPTAYRALDVLALTSESEGLPRVLMEAMAAGLPVVARSVGGIPEMLSMGGGMLIEGHDPAAFANAYAKALNPETANTLRSNMPKALERFDSSRQIAALQSTYERLWREAKRKFNQEQVG